MTSFTKRVGDIDIGAEQRPDGGAEIRARHKDGRSLTKDDIEVSSGNRDDGTFQVTIAPKAPAPVAPASED
jgi:hypothetical protein